MTVPPPRGRTSIIRNGVSFQNAGATNWMTDDADVKFANLRGNDWVGDFCRAIALMEVTVRQTTMALIVSSAASPPLGSIEISLNVLLPTDLRSRGVHTRTLTRTMESQQSVVGCPARPVSTIFTVHIYIKNVLSTTQLVTTPESHYTCRRFITDEQRRRISGSWSMPCRRQSYPIGWVRK